MPYVAPAPPIPSRRLPPLKLPREWRLLAFVALFALSGIAGALLYKSSRPVSPDLLVKSDRPKIDVFVSDPSAAVVLTLEVGGPSDHLLAGSSSNYGALYIHVKPKTLGKNVYFLVTLKGDTYDRFASPVNNYLPNRHNPLPIATFTGNTALNLTGPELTLGHYLTTLRLPHVVRSAHGEIQAQLPILNYLYIPYDSQFVASGCDLADGSATEPFTPSQVNWTSERVPASPCGPPSVFRPDEKAFYSPTTLQSREQLDVDASGYQILTDSPTGAGTVVSQTAQWQGRADLAPSFTAVKSSVQDERSRNSFFAGVALAIAGAALIAALQERRRPTRRAVVDDRPLGD